MTDYNWKPIEPLSDRERRIDLAAMRPLYDSWHASKARLQQSSQIKLAEFNRRLIRRLSVETGILERLYDLDRGTTEALVVHGFVEDLVAHSSTNIEPSRLIDILRDQEAAIQVVMDCVSHSRPLTKGLLHELHAILTRHQETTTAIDQFGNRHEIPLLKGKFKEQPNNPKRPDGSIHEYCPPIHVDSEIEKLLAWLSEYSNDDPVIVAAWFHHRFTQIHPYQDGNGRMARALTTLILLRNDLLPVVVDRDLRLEYIKALELADQCQLSDLAAMLARLERTAVLQALSVEADEAAASQTGLTSRVVQSLAERFEKRRLQKLTELRRVNVVAVELRGAAHVMLEQSVQEIRVALSEVGHAEIRITDGGPDRGNAHWYRFEVVQSAREAGKFANFDEEHYFVKYSIQVHRERLIFVVSLHHVGRELTGVMEATAFSKLVSYEDSDDRDAASEERFSLCSTEPFVFTYKTKVNEITDKFREWLDQALAVALKEYGDQL